MIWEDDNKYWRWSSLIELCTDFSGTQENLEVPIELRNMIQSTLGKPSECYSNASLICNKHMNKDFQ
jgi:hypothetical protein